MVVLRSLKNMRRISNRKGNFDSRDVIPLDLILHVLRILEANQEKGNIGAIYQEIDNLLK